MKLVNFIILFLLLTCALNGFSNKIRHIHFDGLTKTTISFLKIHIRCKEGADFNENTYHNDVQRLKNLNLFFNVTGETQVLNDSVDIRFIIREAKYLYPIIYAGGFNDQLQILLGANHINWHGKGQHIGGHYQYYDRHSFKFYQNTPWHKNGKTGHSFSIGKYSTIEPLYFNNLKSDFNFDNYSVSIGGHYWLTEHLKVELGGMFMYERYHEREPIFENFFMKSDFEFTKHQIRSTLDYNKINQHYELRNGIGYQLHLENIETHGFPEASFFKLVQQIKVFKRIGEFGNFAFRNSFGLATNNDSPFTPFVLDGFINIRGIGNRISRGTAEAIFNFEFRERIFEHQKFILQAVSFLDAGTIRSPGAKFITMFDNEVVHYYAGLGIRFHSRFFYNSVLRIDYGLNLRDISQAGISFGLSQFF